MNSAGEVMGCAGTLSARQHIGLGEPPLGGNSGAMPYSLGRTTGRERVRMPCSARLPGAHQRRGTHAVDVADPAWLRGNVEQRCFWLWQWVKEEESYAFASSLVNQRVAVVLSGG